MMVDTLTEERIRHDLPLKHANFVLVHNCVGHYSAASECLMLHPLVAVVE